MTGWSPHRRLVVAACAVVGFAAMAATAPGATSSVVVTMTVPSASSIAVGQCLTGDPTRTSLGSLLPGGTAITTGDCTITFGSSNDTAMLQVSEQDGTGGSMSRLPHAALDTNTGDGDDWDTDGKSLTDLGGTDILRAVGVQRLGANAGKVVSAGYYGPSTSDSVVMRRTPTGADGSFAGTGLYQHSFGADDEVRDMVVLADDSLIMVGAIDSAVGFAFKLTPNGVLDTSFSGGDGTDGWFTYDPAGIQDFEAVAVNETGRVVIVGDDNGDMLAMAIREDGALDTSFGSSGVQRIDAGTTTDHAEGVSFDSTGRILIAGRRGSAATGESVVARLAANGTPDTFGVGGVRTINAMPGVADILEDVAELPNGRIVAVGNGGTGTSQRAVLVGLTTAGNLDTAGFMAPNGFGALALGNATQASLLHRLVTHADGRFAAAGLAWDTVPDDDFVVSRFLADGSRDPSFGSNGDYVIAMTGSREGNDIGFGLDGKYILAGDGGASDLVTMRVEATKFGDFTSGSQDWTTGTGSFFGVCLRAVGGAASPVWASTGACVSTDATPWRTVPDQPTAGSKAATTTASATGTASFRFGGRAALNQPAGTYEARISFDVVAPAA
ncbi:MAG: hypothetical protein JWM98_2274 [Thermoleophilia bacterium]|nr:hypothetical protein [Thermoleophilia bacterium]